MLENAQNFKTHKQGWKCAYSKALDNVRGKVAL